MVPKGLRVSLVQPGHKVLPGLQGRLVPKVQRVKQAQWVLKGPPGLRVLQGPKVLQV